MELKKLVNEHIDWLTIESALYFSLSSIWQNKIRALSGSFYLRSKKASNSLFSESPTKITSSLSANSSIHGNIQHQITREL